MQTSYTQSLPAPRLMFFFVRLHGWNIWCLICDSEMGQFQDTVQKLVEGMNRHASRIESAKLKALGQRNRVESEKEVRGGGPLHSQGTCFPR
mmetsp:Transcript_492/g.1142  ORF Transcript_492/g.1142 Transcript_492/m.1142 type:complete len:92 (-) Transcript_492:2015-2290(-)